jgi:hypothetical protein
MIISLAALRRGVEDRHRGEVSVKNEILNHAWLAGFRAEQESAHRVSSRW